MKLQLLLFFIAGSCYANAQKGIDAMVNAEKQFAASSVEHGTREAFLRFTDSNSVMFDKGAPVNAHELWLKREKTRGLLNWRPVYAEMAASGDFGYTAGPWTFQQSPGEPVAACGFFFTVWQVDGNNEWKFRVDLGNDSAGIESLVDVQKIQGNQKTSGGSIEDLLSAENDFIRLFRESPARAYEQWLSYQTMVNRIRRSPAISKEDLAQVVAATPANIEFTIKGSGLAGSGDLGFVYGSTDFNNKKDSFLRVWRHEKQGWKIALEIVRF